jgi:hypothetical protein
MADKLMQALRKKFRTPADVMKRLGLDPDLISYDNIAMDQVGQVKAQGPAGEPGQLPRRREPSTRWRRR